MKLCHCLSPFGSVAGIFLSLVLGAGSRAQDLLVQPPHAATTAGAQTPNLAACSPDGEFYALATPNGRITYGRTQDGATLRTFYQCHPRGMVFSPDGRLLAVAGRSNGSRARIKVWNVDDGTLLCRIETEGGSDPLLSFSPDGRRLVSTSGGSQINFWQLPEGMLRCWTTTSQTISCIAFSNDGDAVVVICADGKAQRISVP